YVVTCDVRADHRELGARAEHGRAEVAREEPLHPSPDGDVERAEQTLGHGAGAGTRRCRAREERARVPHRLLTPRSPARGRAAAPERRRTPRLSRWAASRAR